MSPKLRTFIPAAFFALLLDQATKLWVIAAIERGHVVPVIEPVFYLTHVRNPGASFSLFIIEDPALRIAVFGTLSLIAIGVILDFVRRLEPGARASALALGLILGGAVGNLVDRLVHAEVVDFLRVWLTPTYSWPDFNLADSFIVCGVLYLVFEAFFSGDAGEESSA
ncbi:MAG: signal peptidase II [Deltaproteobacteria bacterium]|nr:MAG: signal peptidase II [Deltaproteobacteria bacterium]